MFGEFEISVKKPLCFKPRPLRVTRFQVMASLMLGRFVKVNLSVVTWCVCGSKFRSNVC